MKATTALRQLIATPGVHMAPGAYNAYVAKLIEREGFPLLYMSGSATASAMLGVADVGLITMTEMVTNAKNIVKAVKIPVIADADTGYGNAVNVRRTIEEYESIGVAGVHLEDQVWPKKCGHYEGKRLIPTEEMAQKIRAAVASRQDPDFVIIARTDAIAVTGIDDAVARLAAYAEAGADMIFADAPLSLDHIQRIPKAANVPAFFNMGSSGKTPYVTTDQLAEFGFKIAIYPGFPHMAAMYATVEFLRELRRTGTVVGFMDRMIPFKEFFGFAGLEELMEWEKRYGVEG